MFSSFDLALSGLLRNCVGLCLFLLGNLLFVGTCFAEFVMFLLFLVCCAIRCRLISLIVFQALLSIFVLLFIEKMIFTVCFLFICVENF